MSRQIVVAVKSFLIHLTRTDHLDRCALWGCPKPCFPDIALDQELQALDSSFAQRYSTDQAFPTSETLEPLSCFRDDNVSLKFPAYRYSCNLSPAFKAAMVLNCNLSLLCFV